MHSHFISYLGFFSTEEDQIHNGATYMLLALCCQYHSCWCPGDLRSKDISRRGIDQISRNIPSLAPEEWMIFNTFCWSVHNNMATHGTLMLKTGNCLDANLVITSSTISVNIGSDNGLMPDGTKPLYEPLQVYSSAISNKHKLIMTTLHFQFRVNDFRPVLMIYSRPVGVICNALPW